MYSQKTSCGNSIYQWALTPINPNGQKKLGLISVDHPFWGWIVAPSKKAKVGPDFVLQSAEASTNLYMPIDEINQIKKHIRLYHKQQRIQQIKNKHISYHLSEIISLIKYKINNLYFKLTFRGNK